MEERYLYRGKILTSKTWIIGHLIVDKDGKHYILPTKAFMYGNGMMLHVALTEVDPATIGQCTGLRETVVNGEYKSGDLIFEGDAITIATYSYHEPSGDYSGIVAIGPLGYGLHYSDGYGGQKWVYLCELQGSHITHYSKYGNIHDNHELLAP